MKKNTLLFLSLFILCSQAFAEFEIGVNLGYGFKSGSLLGDAYGLIPDAEYDKTNDTTYVKYNDLYTAFGNGLKFDLYGTYYFNDNIGLMFITGFSFLGGFSAEQSRRVGTTTRIDKYKFTSNYIPLNLGLKFRTQMGKFEPYLYLAPGMYIPITHGHFNDTIDVSMKLTPAWGFTSGIGGIIQLTEKFGLSFECTPTYSFARLKEYTEEMSGVKTTVVFKKDEANLPKTVISGTEVTAYEHGGPRYAFSSIAAKIGVVVRFK